MIFAEMQYEQDYSEMHFELVEYLKSKFPDIQHGLQGDSWIWIFEGDEKVAIDSFSSMKHQIKSESSDSDLIEQVIATLSERYKLAIYDDPELEPHEDI
ncbi:hypothetical protein N8198_07045 [Gammaproteobacteria bacterium]|nr:hypothetical protein [Gammaproteobacteria bacterium]